MADKGEGTVHIDEHSNYLVRIPATVLHDSKFSFKHGEKVTVEIDGDHLLVSKKSDTRE